MDERKELDMVFAALAHPTRRKMLELLDSQDLCVTEIADRFPGALNVVSKHLKCLERAGLIRRKRQGRIHRFQLDSAPLTEAAEFIERYRKRWKRQLDRLANYLDQQQKRKSRNASKSNHP